MRISDWSSDVCSSDLGTDLVYWPGGDSAPEDWDGGQVLVRDRTRWKTPSPCAFWDHRGNHPGDIIGYRRAVAEIEDSDPVQIETKTEEHDRKQFRTVNNPPGTAREDEGCVGKESDSTCRTRWSPAH